MNRRTYYVRCFFAEQIAKVTLNIHLTARGMSHTNWVRKLGSGLNVHDCKAIVVGCHAYKINHIRSTDVKRKYKTIWAKCIIFHLDALLASLLVKLFRKSSELHAYVIYPLLVTF